MYSLRKLSVGNVIMTQDKSEEAIIILTEDRSDLKLETVSEALD